MKAKKLREVRSMRLSVRFMKCSTSRTNQCSRFASTASSAASTFAASPAVLTTTVPMCGSLTRRRSSASSSSRNARSGQN